MDKLHVLVKHMMTSDLKPMLNQASFERYLNWGFEDRQSEKEQILSELFREMDTAINTIPAGAVHRSEIRELYRFIQTEVNKEAANHSLIQASLYYLEREKELKSLVVQLRNIIFSGI